MADDFRSYKAEPTIWKWLNSTEDRTMCVGPVGSGKSSGFAMKCFLIACRVMPDPTDGIRKSVIAICRNTEKMLLRTVYPTFEKWFPPDGKQIKFFKKEMKFEIDMNTSLGRIQSTWYLVALDKPDDVRNLLSLEVTAFGFDEFREIHPKIYQKAITRTGRFPATIREGGVKDGKILYGPYDDYGNKVSEVFAVSNCPEEGSFYGNSLLNPEEDLGIYWQPGGKDPNAENLANLEEGYYDKMIMANINDQNLINVDVHAKLGQPKGGKPVYQGFIPDVHVSKEIMKPIQGQPVIVGMDFALNPAAVFVQQDFTGQLRVLHELTASGMGLEQFLERFFLPLRKNEYLGCPIKILGDPSGVNRAETDMKTVYSIMKSKGLNAMPAETNNIIARITSVEQMFTKTTSDGRPKLIFNKTLKLLIAGLRGAYKYKERKGSDTGELLSDKPNKDKYSHCQDALQYACLHWNNPAAPIRMERPKYTPSNKPVNQWGGY